MQTQPQPAQRTTRREFVHYSVVGGSSFAIDMGTLIAFRELLGIPAYIAVLINQAIVVAYNFTLNKHWTFRNKAMARAQFIKYLSLYGFNYALAVLFMFIFNEQMGVDYRVVRTGTVMLSVCWNFLLYKYWVFGPKKALYTAEGEGT